MSNESGSTTLSSTLSTLTSPILADLPGGDGAWYALRLKPREDGRAYENLLNQSYRIYQPRLFIEKVTTRKRNVVEEPLFPGYLFIRLNTWSDNWGPLRSTRGVIGMVRFGDQPATVREEVIHQIVERERALRRGGVQPMFAAGQKVGFTEGPFEGLEAVFCEADGEKRAIVLLDFMQKQHRLAVKSAQLKAV